MLYHFLRDMWDILRLRYKTPADYRYTLPVSIAVLLLLGLINAAATSPIFGKSPVMVALAVLLTVLKCTVLSAVMGGMLADGAGRRLPLWGFVLASEALSVPLLALFYIPTLATAGLFWQMWIFWVQAWGFAKMSGRPGWRVLLGYAAYALLALILGSLLMMVFAWAGWLDLAALAEQAKIVLEGQAR